MGQVSRMYPTEAAAYDWHRSLAPLIRLVELADEALQDAAHPTDVDAQIPTVGPVVELAEQVAQRVGRPVTR